LEIPVFAMFEMRLKKDWTTFVSIKFLNILLAIPTSLTSWVGLEFTLTTKLTVMPTLGLESMESIDSMDSMGGSRGYPVASVWLGVQ